MYNLQQKKLSLVNCNALVIYWYGFHVKNHCCRDAVKLRRTH